MIWARGAGDLDQTLGRVKEVRGEVIEVRVGILENLEHTGEDQVYFGGSIYKIC